MRVETGRIRHFVDSKGNTLLHLAARHDQLETLKWLVDSLDAQGFSEDALNTLNRAGITVLRTALKVMV